MTTTILAAGDHFVLPSLLTAALHQQAPDGAGLDIRELTLPWPLTPFGPVAEVDEASGTEDELIEALDGATVCVTQMAPLTERVLAACPELKLFCVARGGPVNANLEAATRHGVAVCFAPGRNAAATAEHTLALMLAAARKIPALHNETAAGQWRSDHYAYEQCGFEIDGAHVGLVGYGAIGSRVAAALEALGAHVLVHDPYIDAAQLHSKAELVGLDELLSRSQIVSLHARVTDETTGLISADRLAALPRGSILVNAARGALVDYEAVCDALESGQLAAAAFDVYDAEPIPAGARILKAPNVVLSPHIAGASKQVAHKAAAIAAAEAARFLRGQPPANCANPQALDSP